MHDYAVDMAGVPRINGVAVADNPIGVATANLLRIARKRPLIIAEDRVKQVCEKYFEMSQSLERLLHRVAHPSDEAGSGVTLAPCFNERAHLADAMSGASPAVAGQAPFGPRFAESVEKWLGEVERQRDHAGKEAAKL